MGVFDMMKKYGHEQVIFNYDKKTGLKCIIAIHNTSLGPANGGCRMRNYETEKDALIDALRLSRGMTYKSAAAGLMFGGGKTVMWADPKEKTPEMFYALGRFVATLHGRFYTGTDMGTTPMDFVEASKISPYFGGKPAEFGGLGDSGVPTAYGVFVGLKACLQKKFGNESFKGLKVAVQGVGKAGGPLVKYLVDNGAKVVLTDMDMDKARSVAKKYGAEVVEPDAIYDVECDIFSPNAVGAILNDDTIKRLRCQIVGGAANNQLAEPRHGRMLMDKGILYAPDFIINAGGVIAVGDEWEATGYNEKRTLKKTEGIYDRLLRVWAYAEQKDLTPQEAAEQMTDEIINTVAEQKREFVAS